MITIKEEGIAIYSKEEEDFLEQRSKDNLVETYREELHKIIKGHNCVDFISFNARRRLRKYGIIKKIQSKYIVTELGKEMLSEEASTQLVKL